jgi:hypothetical protein
VMWVRPACRVAGQTLRSRPAPLYLSLASRYRTGECLMTDGSQGFPVHIFCIGERDMTSVDREESRPSISSEDTEEMAKYGITRVRSHRREPGWPSPEVNLVRSG